MTTTQGIHIVGMEIRNMYRIRFARVKFIPGVGFVKVTGDNGDGKTSVIRAAMACFGGASEVLSSALNDESDGEPGYAVMELSNGYTVRRDITEANPKGTLRVMGPDGGKHGQKKLNGWLGEHHDFDVLAFFGLKAPRQREILLGLGKDPNLAKKLAKKRGEHDALYEERTPVIAEQRRARAISKPDGERPEQVDVSAEMEKLRELQVAKARRHEVGVELNGFREKLAANKARTTEIGEVKDGIVGRAEAELKDFMHKITVQEDCIARAVAAYEDGLATLQQARAKLMTAGKEVKATFEAMADVSADIETVTANISEADAVNEDLAPWKLWDTAGADLAAATATCEALTASMILIKESETKLIAAAGIPVEGISFSDQAEPLLNGRPLDVASGAERIRMSVAVAIAEDPELRVCLIDEANDLGLKAMEELDRQATDHDFQIIGCRLGIEGPGEIIVNDGLAWSKGDEDAVADLDDDLDDDSARGEEEAMDDGAPVGALSMEHEHAKAAEEATGDGYENEPPTEPGSPPHEADDREQEDLDF